MTEFIRHLGFFENWAATYITMNFVSGASCFPCQPTEADGTYLYLPPTSTTYLPPGMPVLFGFAMTTGGPKSAFANWTMIGGYVSKVVTYK